MKSYLNFLLRNKLYAAIEVFGISVALAFIIPLVSYLTDMWTIDHENPDYARIYTFTFYPSQLAGTFDQPEFLENNIPEVEETTLFSSTRPADIKCEDESYGIQLLLCDLNYFDFVPTRFLAGNPNVLSDNTSALVSESFAARLGYGHDAVGKHFTLDGIEYTIEGIIANYERSIMLPHDVVINIAGPTLQYYRDHPQRVHQMNHCLFRVKQGTDRKQLTEKIIAAGKVHYTELYRDEILIRDLAKMMQLVRYDEITKQSSHTMTAINPYIFRALLVLSLVLLVFALFNYIALNIAMGTFRAKEMATRQLLGATRGEIVVKLLCESLLMTTVCFLLGLLLSFAILPVINQVFRVASVAFTVRVALTPLNIVVYLLLILLISVVAGAVPALMLSRYKPIDVVKGEFRSRNKMVFSKVFIFIQCLVTMVLLTLALVYALQYRKMVNLPLGVEADDVYYLYGPYAHHELDPCVEALRSLPCVEKVGKCDDFPGSVSSWAFLPMDNGYYSMGYYNENGERDDIHGVPAEKLICSREAFEIYGFTIVRDFHRDGERVGWLTETLVEQLGLNHDDPQLTEDQMERLGITTIGGVIADFRANFYTDEACFVSVQEDWYESATAYYKSLAIKTVGSHAAAEKDILDCIKRTSDDAWGVYKEPHQKGYVHDLLRDSLEDERVLMTTITIFAALMLLLSLLGLMGMSTWYVSLRQHDVAIRKVFGGTVVSETLKNVRTYMIVVLSACAVGVPVAYYLSEQLLASYVHRISLSALIFVTALLVVVAFSAFVVTMQTLRVTKMNPANVLKKE